MRSFPGEPVSESTFYQLLRDNTASVIFYERVEPRTEGGFPDVYFVLRTASGSEGEGTIELKYSAKSGVDVRKLLRASQLTNILDYHAAGGKRRFLLAYLGGVVVLYDTAGYAEIARNGSQRVRPVLSLDVKSIFPKMDSVASARYLSKALVEELRG